MDGLNKMVMLKYIQITIACLLTLTSCVSGEIQNAAREAAISIQATQYSVGSGAYAGTGEENYKSFNITFSDFAELPDNYDTRKLSSTGALVFFKKLKPADYEGIDKIKVTITNNNTSMEALYDIKQLSETDAYFPAVTKLIESFKNKSFTTMQSCIDSTAISSENQEGIYKVVMNLDSLYGKIDSYMYTGFDLKEIKEVKEPVFIAWGVLKHERAQSRLKVVVHTVTKKILYIGINGAE